MLCCMYNLNITAIRVPTTINEMFSFNMKSDKEFSQLKANEKSTM